MPGQHQRQPGHVRTWQFGRLQVSAALAVLAVAASAAVTETGAVVQAQRIPAKFADCIVGVRMFAWFCEWFVRTPFLGR